MGVKRWRSPLSSGSSGRRSPGGEDAHGILEGVSSLHSWIKKQTMIRPTHKMSQIRSQYDKVRFFLLERNCCDTKIFGSKWLIRFFLLLWLNQNYIGRRTRSLHSSRY